MAMTDADLGNFITNYCGLVVPTHYYNTVWGGDILISYANCKWGHWIAFAGTVATYYEDLTISQFIDQIFGLVEYMITPEKKKYKSIFNKVEDYKNGNISYESIIDEFQQLDAKSDLYIKSMLDFVIINERAIQYAPYTIGGITPNSEKWGILANATFTLVSQLASLESSKEKPNIFLLTTFAEKLKLGWVYPIPP